MKITTAFLSEEGDRDYNEDCIGIVSDGVSCMLAVADGLGGHGKGEIASQTAVQAVKDVYSVRSENLIGSMIQEAQDRVIRLQEEANDSFSMKTTLVTAVVSGGQLEWGHIGDSRLYIFQGKKLIQRTLDHSVPQMLVNSGEIREKDIRGHADRNKLLRVIGIEWESPRYQLGGPYMLNEDTQLLLCSDGFWENIDEKHMLKLLRKSSSPESWLSSMKEEVMQNGRNKNMDNFSAVCAFVEV